jgi:hypothetical protein
MLWIKKAIRLLMLFFWFLLILEVASRALLSVKSVNRVVRKSVCDVTRRWDWLESHKKGMLIGHPYNKYDPSKGWGMMPNISGMKWFGNEYISSNSRGIRGGSEHSYTKDRGKLRILFLGDSYTFGDEVSDNETYPDYLQQMLPDVEVINMGMSGYGHDQMLIYLKEEGVKYQPDIVILGYLSMDSERNMLEFSYYAKPKFELADNRLELRNVPVPSPDIVLRREPWRSKFVDLLSLLRHCISMRRGAYLKQKKCIETAILKEMVTTAKRIGAVPVFAYLNNVRSVKSDPSAIEEEKIFLDKCKGLSAKCVFLRNGVYFARLSGANIKERGHFGQETNQLVALGIKKYLLEEGLLDRK